MVKNKDVRLIPYWIVEAVQRRQLPISAVFDVQQLMHILSINDLIGYCAMDDVSIQEILFGTHPTSIDDAGKDTCYSRYVITRSNYQTLAYSPIDMRQSNPAMGAAIDEFNLKVGNLYLDQSVVDELKSRLFTEACKEEKYKEPFKIIDVSPQYYGVVIYPGYFVPEQKEQLLRNQTALIRSIQKQLYVYADFNEVCMTPLFRRYLDRLAESLR